MNAASPIRILTVDDHPMLREGIAALLGSETDMALVAEASDGREAIEEFQYSSSGRDAYGFADAGYEW